MPTLKLRFPGGRYHATPWGHHVNEGLIEWPPSPWRLLRALVACGFSSQGWTEIPLNAQQLIDKLAAVLPSYRLPEASTAHSRHFMPIGVLAKGREQTTLVFDTWANVGNGEVLIHWPCEITDDESQLLAHLVEALGYLGRSESWVEAKLIAKDQDFTLAFNTYPHRVESIRPGRDYEQVSLMAAIPPDEYAVWRQQATVAAIVDFPLPAGKKKTTAKLLRDRDKAIEPYPSDLLSCLTKDTAWWKQQGWSQPPGSQRVLYWRPSDSLQVGPPRSAVPRAESPVNMILLAITSASGNRSALPPCKRTLPQAELFHRAIVGRVAKGQRVHCPELTGRDEDGEPLRGSHGHAHVLPVDLDADGHLDHIIIHATMGLKDAAQRAIRTMRRTWTKGGAGDLQVAVAASGCLDVLRSLPAPLDIVIRRLVGPIDGACVWISTTPFVPPRYIKRRGANTLFGQVNAELTSRGLAAATQVDLLESETVALRHYVRRRQRGGNPPPIDVGYAMRLVFAQPMFGPLSLGYGSHFGLGLFQSDSDP